MVERREIDLLLSGGTVVTIDPERRIVEDGAVAIDAGRIVAVGTADELGQRFVGRETIDCRGKAVLPGLIDAHGHGGHSLIKTIGADTPSLWMRIVTASRSIGITACSTTQQPVVMICGRHVSVAGVHNLRK